ncbi:MAG: sigma-70 family RNA polymerase sigma factor [Synechococcales bacterium]|nr:sigma-70 family RNA polymerase sigma factor [Synechococcales bacterium]
MKKREDVISQFSTFLQFKPAHEGVKDKPVPTQTSTPTQWVSSRELRLSMQSAQKDSPTLSEPIVCAIHWFQTWQRDRRARQHLYAYLQESAYSAAFRQQKQYEQKSYSLAEYFQIAIAGTDKVLTSFQPDRNRDLRPFALIKFTNLIKDGLVREGLSDVQIRSLWSILRQSSETRVQTVLQAEARTAEQIQGILLAWDCYKQLYVPSRPRGNRQLTEPDNWEAIAQEYNRQQRSHPTAQPTNHSAHSIQQQLQALGRSLRNYATLPMQTLQGNPSDELEDEPPMAEEIPDRRQSPLEQLMQSQEAELWQERRAWFEQFLHRTIAELDQQTQTLLQLIYLEGLTQKEIGDRLNISQPTASRRIKQLQQVKQQWLLKLAEQAQQDLNISLDTTVIDLMSQALEEWLTLFYSSLLDSSLLDSSSLDDSRVHSLGDIQSTRNSIPS